MTSKYRFSQEEINAIVQAQKKTKDEQVALRLKALLMRAQGNKLKVVSETTGLHSNYIVNLVQRFKAFGLESILVNHRFGDRLNAIKDDEEAILAPFAERCERGELLEIGEVTEAFRKAAGYSISLNKIQTVLHQHGWRLICTQ